MLVHTTSNKVSQTLQDDFGSQVSDACVDPINSKWSSAARRSACGAADQTQHAGHSESEKWLYSDDQGRKQFSTKSAHILRLENPKIETTPIARPLSPLSRKAVSEIEPLQTEQ